jgi:hypothetical protein
MEVNGLASSLAAESHEATAVRVGMRYGVSRSSAPGPTKLTMSSARTRPEPVLCEPFVLSLTRHISKQKKLETYRTRTRTNIHVFTSTTAPQRGVRHQGAEGRAVNLAAEPRLDWMWLVQHPTNERFPRHPSPPLALQPPPAHAMVCTRGKLVARG